MSRGKLYGLVLLLSIAGYIWLFLNYRNAVSGVSSVCLFKKVTGIPCPSCGTTRSVLAILNGDISGAVYANPLGFILGFALLVIPLWVIIDLLFNRSSFLAFYMHFEHIVKKKWIAIPAIAIILILWIINIRKNI